jgi:hypothetical protein
VVWRCLGNSKILKRRFSFTTIILSAPRKFQ